MRNSGDGAAQQTPDSGRCPRCSSARLRQRVYGLNHLLLQLTLVFTAGALVAVIFHQRSTLLYGVAAAMVWLLLLRPDRTLLRRTRVCRDCGLELGGRG